MKRKNLATKAAAVLLSAAMVMSGCPAYASDEGTQTASETSQAESNAESVESTEEDTEAETEVETGIETEEVTGTASDELSEDETDAEGEAGDTIKTAAGETLDDATGSEVGMESGEEEMTAGEEEGEEKGEEEGEGEEEEEEAGEEEEEEEAQETEVRYGTMAMTYAEFYSGLVSGVSSIDAVSSATTSKYSMFANEYISEVTSDGYTIYGVKNVPVMVTPDASAELLERITFNEDPYTAEEGQQYWSVDANGVTAPTLNIIATVTDATATLSTSSHWGDYLVEVDETSTSYLRNAREDTFAVGSNILGIVVSTTDGSTYGLTHMNNIWVQTFEFAFNASDSNTAGLVGKTICTITYIVEDGAYVYSFADGIYVTSAYEGEVTGSFTVTDEATTFTLDETLSSSIVDATISVTYKVGRNTYTLLEATSVGSETVFTLSESLPEDAVPTVTISSANYSDITVSYPMFDWQKEELTALVEAGSAIVEASEDPDYSYATLAAHVAEGEEILENGTASEADEIISELAELIEAAKTLYGTMSMTYEEFYASTGLLADSSAIDAVSSATTGKSTMFANADTTEVTEDGYSITGVKNIPVKALPSASSELRARVTESDDVTSESLYWLVDSNGISVSLPVAATVTDAIATLSTSSHWGDYLVEVDETSTSYLRNAREDTFAVGSNILGIVVSTEEGHSYGLTHMNNIWVQTYEFAFNASDSNTAGLVGETISTVTYIVSDGLYVYTFEDGIYVKPAYSAEITGSFAIGAETTAFTLDEALPESLVNAVITITYKESYTTYTLLAETEVGDALTFTLEETIPVGVTPTVTISSDNYADIEVSYGNLLWPMENCAVTLSETVYTYDGTAKTPEVTVSYGETQLTADTDYTVSYSDNVKAGTATVTVTGIGSFTGTVTATFQIKKASSSGNSGSGSSSGSEGSSDSGSETTVKEGLVFDDDEVFRYYENGIFAEEYVGVVPYDNGLFFIKNGLVDTDANELCLYEDVWYYVALGQVQLSYTGLAMHDGSWFYITDGILDTSKNGLVPYDGETFLVAAGRLLVTYNGLWQNSSTIGGDDLWYFIGAGMVQNVSQIVMYDGEFFVVENGILDTDYNGTIVYDNGIFLVVNGQLYA